MPIPDDDVLMTPEGDNEDDLNLPLSPIPADAELQIPPGNAPNPVEEDHKPKGIERFIDEVVRGEYM